MENRKKLEMLRAMLGRPENRYCVDCRAEGPTWASINLGIFLCLDCAGIHRSLGTHISKVRSVTMDTWLPEWVKFMSAVGNARANSYWEMNNKFGEKLSSRADGSTRAKFIRAKYEEKKWYGIPSSVPQQPVKPVSASSASAPSSGVALRSASPPTQVKNNSAFVKSMFQGLEEADQPTPLTTSTFTPPPQPEPKSLPPKSQPTQNFLISANVNPSPSQPAQPEQKKKAPRRVFGSPWVKRDAYTPTPDPVVASKPVLTQTVSAPAPLQSEGNDLFDGLDVNEKKESEKKSNGYSFANLLDDDDQPEAAAASSSTANNDLSDTLQKATISGTSSGFEFLGGGEEQHEPKSKKEDGFEFLGGADATKEEAQVAANGAANGEADGEANGFDFLGGEGGETSAHPEEDGGAFGFLDTTPTKPPTSQPSESFNFLGKASPAQPSHPSAQPGEFKGFSLEAEESVPSKPSLETSGGNGFGFLGSDVGGYSGSGSQGGESTGENANGFGFLDNGAEKSVSPANPEPSNANGSGSGGFNGFTITDANEDEDEEDDNGGGFGFLNKTTATAGEAQRNSDPFAGLI
ncbi:hypothetical protein AAMO2058_000457200 [Amorphochlora amoebiformis]